MSDSKHLVHRFIQLINEQDIDGLREVIADGYVQHNPMIDQGLKGIQEGMRMFLAVFPDLRAAAEDLTAEGDKVVGRFTWRGTHAAAFLGVPASGRTATWTSADFWRVEDGKLAEHWDVVDWAGLLAQLQGDQSDTDSVNR